MALDVEVVDCHDMSEQKIIRIRITNAMRENCKIGYWRQGKCEKSRKGTLQVDIAKNWGPSSEVRGSADVACVRVTHGSAK